MTRDQLAAAHATAIRKHYRKLEDHPGRVHTELLDDLAHIADEHAADRVAADRVTPPDGEPERPAATRRRTARAKP